MSENLAKVLSPRPVLAGQLHKYTNVVKGWQYRYFRTDELTGFLNYYVTESSEFNCTVFSYRRYNPTSFPESGPEQDQVPRGQVHLAGAVISPSDEDSRTFTISCASGDILKLRAVDARARQEWVDGLRAISESHTLALSSSNLLAREHLAAHDALAAVRSQLHQTEICNANLARLIESLDTQSLPPIDPELLTLKALSGANTHVLQQCLGILQKELDQGSGDIDAS